MEDKFDNKTFTFDRETGELIIMEDKKRAIVLNKHEAYSLFTSMLNDYEYQDMAISFLVNNHLVVKNTKL